MQLLIEKFFCVKKNTNWIHRVIYNSTMDTKPFVPAVYTDRAGAWGRA